MARMTRRRTAVAGVAATLVVVPGVAVAGTGVLDDDATDTPITGDALDRATAAAVAAYPGGTVTETEVGDEESMYEVEVLTADGRSVDVQLDEGFAVVGTEDDGPEGDEDDGPEGDEDDETDTPITGDALDQATAAAVAAYPGGTVTETEVGDEESMYEVEVLTADGRSVDVQLDEGFAVVGTEDDGPEGDEVDD